MTKETWDSWKSNWEWILEVAKQRQWEVIEDLTIKPPVSLQEVRLAQEQLNITLPGDFVDVLTNYSSGVSFFLQIKGEETAGVYRNLSSAGNEHLWSFGALPALKESYDGWVKSCFNNEEDEYERIWHQKVPFISIPTGDLIAFDISSEAADCPVVFLSHDGSDLHGKRLGYNFIDFMSRWSNIGCFGPEDWQLVPFYDEEENILSLHGPVVKSWKDWLLT